MRDGWVGSTNPFFGHIHFLSDSSHINERVGFFLQGGPYTAR